MPLARMFRRVSGFQDTSYKASRSRKRFQHVPFFFHYRRSLSFRLFIHSFLFILLSLQSLTNYALFLNSHSFDLVYRSI